MNEPGKSLTDWARVKAFREGNPIPYNPEDGPEKSPAQKQVSLRLSPEVLAR